jgi:hypothetical protein
MAISKMAGLNESRCKCVEGFGSEGRLLAECGEGSVVGWGTVQLEDGSERARDSGHLWFLLV